jgi:hypothetical protein
VSLAIERPLKLGEVLAETVRLYGERVWAAFGVGALLAGAYLVSLATPAALDVVVLALAFTTCFAASARVAAGDSFAEALGQAGVRLPVLLVLTIIVSVPFALAVAQLFLLLLAVAWLAFSAFSIPVAMLERERGEPGWFGRLSFALWRSVALARAEYLHAAGVTAALVVIYAVFGVVLAGAFRTFADNEPAVAIALTNLVLAPFFFFGLSVLYFEQKARALSSRSEHPETREDADAEVPDALDAERAGPADAPREPRARP